MACIWLPLPVKCSLIFHNGRCYGRASKVSQHMCCLWRYIYKTVYCWSLYHWSQWYHRNHRANKNQPCWKLCILKAGSMQPCLYSGNPILKQPCIQAAQVAGKTLYTALCRRLLLPGSKLAENWDWKELFYLEDSPAKAIYLKWKGKHSQGRV